MKDQCAEATSKDSEKPEKKVSDKLAIALLITSVSLALTKTEQFS